MQIKWLPNCVAGRYVVSSVGRDGMLKLWDTDSGLLLASHDQKTNLLCCAASFNDQLIAVAGGSGTVGEEANVTFLKWKNGR
jgi:hypothetical protein